MKTFEFKLSTIRLEEDFRTHKSFVAYNDGPSIGQVVGLVIIGIVLRFLKFLVKVLVNNITQFLFDVPYYFDVSRCCETVTFIFQKLAEILCDVFTRKHNSLNGVWDSIPFIDRDCVRDSIS